MPIPCCPLKHSWFIDEFNTHIVFFYANLGILIKMQIISSFNQTLSISNNLDILHSEHLQSNR